MFVIEDKEYNSYFYIIRHKPTGKIYAGCRYAKDCNPLELLRANTGYYTSSKIVSKLIKQDGLRSFEILEIRIFKERNQAYLYESIFLQYNLRVQPRLFLNKSCNESCRYPEERLNGEYGELFYEL